jgi:hypothetical protein
MVPVFQLQVASGERPVDDLPTAEVAWINQATWHHCHFGLKSAPHHRDFRPAKEGVL